MPAPSPHLSDAYSGCSDVMSLAVALYAIKVRLYLRFITEHELKAVS